MSQDWNQPSEQDSPLSYSDKPVQQSTPVPPPVDTTVRVSKTRRNYTWIYLSVIALLLGTCIYLFLNRNAMIEQRNTAMLQVDSVSTSRDDLQKEYDAALVRLDDLVSKNTELNSQIQNSNGEVAKLKQQIDGIMRNKNATEKDLKKARQLINTLNHTVRSYEDQIAELKGENEHLTTQNQSLTQERDSTVTENQSLKRVGSVLHASNIRMIPIDLRRNGSKEKETTKARRVDVLRILFDIDENRIAESGNKEIFLRITGPDGMLLSNAAYGSGMTTTEQGERIGYTLSREILITKSEMLKDVAVDWKQDSDYRRGSYLIELYHQGFRIGSGGVTLR